jgi:transposase
MARNMSVLGIDIAKLVLHVVGMDHTGHVVLRKRIARSELLDFIAQLPPLRIGMEACGSAHDWARRVREQGHDVRRIAPPFITAVVQSPMHEARDAEASCEAVTRPTRRVVPITRVEPQDLQARPRVRARLMKARTALVHESRGRLSAYGSILPHSRTKLRALIVDQRHEAQAKRTTLSAEVFWPLYDEFRALEKRVLYDDEKLAARGQAHPACQRLQTIPGIGHRAHRRARRRDPVHARPPAGGACRGGSAPLGVLTNLAAPPASHG